MIKPEVIQRIKETATIMDVVSDYVSLRRNGATYKGLCPFHNEKTPSFIVTPAKNICKCFGCGKGGSPINFVMEIEHVSYAEAIKLLGKKYGIEVEEKELTEEEKLALSKQEKLGKATEWLQEIFVKNLETEEGRAVGLSYFQQRGLTDATIKKFGLGYALVDRNSYWPRAEREGFLQSLVELGHVSQGNYGTSDFYAARAIFPIHSISGKVIAFGARGIRQEDIDKGKYRNSPENELYKKSNTLYGLCFARTAIHRKEKAYISEGYLDVISMHQAGIENIVAPCGTALTEGQVRLLKRNLPSKGNSDSEEKFVTMLYDGDKAGMNAAIKNGKLLLSEGLNVSLIILPEGEDPDSFAQSHNANEVEDYLDSNEQDYIIFRANLLRDEADNDPLKRATAVKTIAEVIAVIPDAIKRVEYAKAVSKILDTENSIVMEYVGKERAKQAENKQKEAFREQQRKEMEKRQAAVQQQFPQQAQYPQGYYPQPGYYPQQGGYPAQYPAQYPQYPQYGQPQGLQAQPQEEMPDEAFFGTGSQPSEEPKQQEVTGIDRFSESLLSDLYRKERDIIELVMSSDNNKIIELRKTDDNNNECKEYLTAAGYFEYEFNEEKIYLTHPIFSAMLKEASKVMREETLSQRTLSDYFQKHENTDFNDASVSIEMDKMKWHDLLSDKGAKEVEEKESSDIIANIKSLINKFKTEFQKDKLANLNKELSDPEVLGDAEQTTMILRNIGELNRSINAIQIADGVNNVIKIRN